MNYWTFRGRIIKSIKDIPECCPFMVYRIDFNDNTYYIGSQQIISVTNPKISKKRANQLYTGKGRKKVRETKVQEKKGWLEYCSSSKIVQEKVKDTKFNKYIIDFFNTKQEMLLYEASLIINAFIIRDEKVLNEWVNVKSFKLKSNE